MQENNVDVIFDAISENESFARVVAAAFETRLDPTLEEISDIKTAVSEAVTNSIVHGYEGKGGKVYMTLSLEDRRIVMRDDTQLLNNGLDSELDSYDTAEDIKRTDYIYMVSGNNLVISLNAELDHHLAEEMRQVIDDVIDKRGVTHIVFDFTKVDFMDSAGIGLIMGRYKKVMDKGDITIVGVRESVKRILLISGLHKIVNIYELKGQEA